MYGSYVENPEFVYVKTDNEDKILWAIKTDGSIYYGVGVPPQIIDYINEKIADFSPNEYNNIVAFLANLEKGDKTLQTLLNEKVDKEEGKSLIDEGVAASQSVIEDPENRYEITLDSEDKIISYRKEDGTKVENIAIETPKIITNNLNLSESGMAEFQQALKDSGFRPGGVGDWSDYISKKGKNPLHIPIPRLAYVNLTNTGGNLVWPTSKTADIEAVMEFADMQGNYFKKNIIFNAQGNSSMSFIKKNGSIKMFDSSVYNSKGKKGKGDKFGVKFGDWVSQTTYHIKAFYTDYFKGVSCIAYQIALEVANTRGIFNDRTWKKGILKDYEFSSHQFDSYQLNDSNLQIDNGALCQPDGFPCIVYLNGEFYGIYVWMLKKDAANFNMQTDCDKHIHLDGRIDNATLFGANGNSANIDWNPNTGFEVRNPENLVTVSGEEYDADISERQELAGVSNIGDTIPSYSAVTEYSKGDIAVFNDRVYLSLTDSNSGNAPVPCENPEDVFDEATDFWIDITFTNEVKKNILTLSTYKSNIDSASDIAIKKSSFEQYFDIDNLIDYLLVQECVTDYDSFAKNWQWTTWDGIKWYINNYDKDCSFGNSFEGTFTSNPQENKTQWIGINNYFIAFLAENYDSELKDRWKELVRNGVFTKENIIGKFKSWCQRIGSDNYAKEYNKWNESPCNRDSGINAEYWKLKSWNYQGSATNYDASKIYTTGETCIIKVHAYSFIFECIKENSNENPITKTYTNYPARLGYRDSLWRVSKYIEDNLNTINIFVNN